MTPPLLVTVCGRYAKAWPRDEGEDDGEVLRLPFADAVAREWPDDRHFQCIIGDGRIARLRLEALGHPGVGRASVALLAFDIDSPERGRWPANWRREAASAVIRSSTYGYHTRGGLRCIYQLAAPFALEGLHDAVRWSRGYRRALLEFYRRTGLIADPACADVTRLYRLPLVVREGQRERRALLGDPMQLATWARSRATHDEDLRTAEQLSRHPVSTIAKGYRSVLRHLQEGEPRESSLLLPSAIAPDARERARRWLQHAEPAIAGARGHATAFRVAVGVVRGFNLDADTALELLEEEWNHRCSPRWSRKELQHKVLHAAVLGDMEWGAKLNERRAS